MQRIPTGPGRSATADDDAVSERFGSRPSQTDPDARRIRHTARERLFGRPAPPTKIDRYEVLGLAGAGGMGVVYIARDPMLDRTVAIKLVRTERVADDLQRAARRFRNEARALARVTDPHTVPVFDIGVADRLLYIVMEYIEGPSLAGWLGHARRRAGEITRLFVQAGLGLAAAHRVGVVHRDFKPANVLIDGTGTARVVDFGLARLQGDPAHVTADTAATQTADRSSESTQPGTIVGTLLYMAPEQRLGLEVDERADQYSFCIALREALKELPADPRIDAAIERGLGFNPDERWPSMEALLGALKPAARGKGIYMAAGVAVLGLGALALPLSNDVTSACGDALSLAPVWSEARRDSLTRTLDHRGDAASAKVSARVGAQLERFTVSHANAAQEVCREGGEVSAAATCLLEARRRFDVTLGVLERVEAGELDGAAAAASRLDDPALCVGANASALARPAEPALRRAVEAAEDRVTRARVLSSLGRDDEAWAEAAVALEESRGLEYAPLLSNALLTAGQVQRVRNVPDEAERLLGEAYALAQVHRRDRVAALAALHVARLMTQQERRAEARTWLRYADAVLERSDDPSLSIQAQVVHTSAWLWGYEGDWERAAGQLEAAVELARQDDPASAMTANFLVDLAYVHQSLGAHERATAEVVEALPLVDASFSPEHRGLPDLLAIAAEVLSHPDADPTRAVSIAQRAVSLVESSQGTSYALVRPLQALVEAQHAAGKYADAAQTARRAMEAVTDFAPDSRMHAAVAASASRSARAVRRFEEADALANDSMRVGELIGDRLMVAQALSALAETAKLKDRREDALGYEQRAEELRDQAPAHP